MDIGARESESPNVQILADGTVTGTKSGVVSHCVEVKRNTKTGTASQAAGGVRGALRAPRGLALGTATAHRERSERTVVDTSDIWALGMDSPLAAT